MRLLFTLGGKRRGYSPLSHRQRRVSPSLAFVGPLACVVVFLFAMNLTACASQPVQPDYAQADSWVEFPEAPTKVADTFFVLPTVSLKDRKPGNVNPADKRTVRLFEKTLSMEKGIVSDSTNVYAPLYRQATLGCYLDADGHANIDADLKEYGEIAYEDVHAAFVHYLESLNEDRPFILFGYSQGADLVLRLLADFGNNETFQRNFVVAYVIGTPVTRDYLQEHPSLSMAQAKDDTGVIVSYNAIDARAALPTGEELSINPLNWRTDATPAPPSQNLGYVVVNTDGITEQEQPAYCGACIDEKSGKLLVTDLAEDSLYNIDDGLFPKGDYHLYDLQLFYRNLQMNVRERLDSFASPG